MDGLLEQEQQLRHLIGPGGVADFAAPANGDTTRGGMQGLGRITQQRLALAARLRKRAIATRTERWVGGEALGCHP